MDVIKATRELGKAIQADDRYLAFRDAQKANEEDIELNGLIGKLNLIQLSYQNESQKEEPDTKKLEGYDNEFREIYGQIMLNENMRKYEETKNAVDEMMNYVIQLLTLTVNGEDPETCEPKAQEEACTGNCASCGGSCG